MEKIKKILIKKDQYDTLYFDVSSPELYKKTLQTIFDQHHELDYYSNLSSEKTYKEYLKDFQTNLNILKDEKDLYKKHKRSEKVSQITKQIEEMIAAEKRFQQQKTLFDKAMNGDVKSLQTFLDLRQDYEYEGFDIKTVQE